jgi:hypothetical protein
MDGGRCNSGRRIAEQKTYRAISSLLLIFFSDTTLVITPFIRLERGNDDYMCCARVPGQEKQ